jgi:hypothetical protein
MGNEIDDAWLGLKPEDYSLEHNPLIVPNVPDIIKQTPGAQEIDILRNPEYLGYTAHLLMGIKLPPFQQAVLYNIWRHPFPMLIGSRGMSKTYLLALYSLMRAVLCPGYKVILAGAGFRQSKMIFEYVENIWNNAPVLRSICNKNSRAVKEIDKWYFRINESTITAIPIGPNGDKVRGLRANCVIADEFASHNPQVVEEVIFGFGAVNNNPVENVIRESRMQKMRELGLEEVAELINNDNSSTYTNQSIISGTADYYFNHFYDYWRRYKAIVESKGDPTQLTEIFHGNVPESFDWKDYCVIRIPYSALPKGFMSDKTIARAKAQMSSALYKKEYEAIFVEDSDGFYRRSLIEKCTASTKNVSKDGWCSWCPGVFDAKDRGSPDGKYIYGIDPASERDNLAITILENYQDHARIVYCWTINQPAFQKQKLAGWTKVDDYYHFIVRKIRDLMKVFPCERIAIDTQGGGYTIIENLHNALYLEPGESPIWSIAGKRAEQDIDQTGLKLIEGITLGDANWVRDANYNMRRDMESLTLLFPQFDAATIELSIVQDSMRAASFEKANPGKKIEIFDSLEDVVQEIEDLKDELTSIIHTRTGTGIYSREKWVVPGSAAQASGNNETNKKDRYSALLMANEVARRLRSENLYKKEYIAMGGLISEVRKKRVGGPLYSGPEWFTNSINSSRLG